MSRAHFISYSKAEAADFARRLHGALSRGEPSFAVWLDQLDLIVGQDWDEQIAAAIRECESLIFVMTPDSVERRSRCKQEWSRALKCKKAILPLLLDRTAEMPFSLEPRQHLDFTGDFATSLGKLRRHLSWLTSPAGLLQGLKDRLEDARRALRRADPSDAPRIADEITQLERQTSDLQRAVDDPAAAKRRVEETVRRGLEIERQPIDPTPGTRGGRIVNPPPHEAPNYFQNRTVETRLLVGFLNDDACRIATVVGRAGVGKTAMVCRLLRALETGQLPDDLGSMQVDGIVYLSARGRRQLNLANMFADMCYLLPQEKAGELDAIYRNPQATTAYKMEALLAAFQQGKTLVLLDNFEDLIDPVSENIRDGELAEALSEILRQPHHTVKVIVTTRIAPRALGFVEPGRYRILHLDEGLEHPFAENILRQLDADGRTGLKNAPAELLAEARQRTRGYPRALEALYAILAADRHTSLREVLNDAENVLPERVVEALVGEAFSRLDSTAQRVMEALAVYRRPVTTAAVDHLLQPYVPGVNSTPILNRLVNMQFARKEGPLYYLHPADNSYAEERVPWGNDTDRLQDGNPPYTRVGLKRRGAEYFRQARKARADWKTLEDLAPQLAEFELRRDGRDYDAAAHILEELLWDHLFRWGYYQMAAHLLGSLEGLIVDAQMRDHTTYCLGAAFLFMAEYGKAAAALRKVLNRTEHLGLKVGCLTGLGACSTDMGDTAKGIEYLEEALKVMRGWLRYRDGSTLNNLAIAYGHLGDPAKAAERYLEALKTHQALGERRGEGVVLGNLAEVCIDMGKYDEAIEHGNIGVRLADEVGDTNLRSFNYRYLALAYLGKGDLSSARRAAEKSSNEDEPRNRHNALALLGLIAFREGDLPKAHEAFLAAVTEADKVLAVGKRNFDAHEARGLALCGLALCTEGDSRLDGMTAAVEAYKAARAITRDAGTVARALRIFDELRKCDREGRLAGVRPVVAGQQAISDEA